MAGGAESLDVKRAFREVVEASTGAAGVAVSDVSSRMVFGWDRHRKGDLVGDTSRLRAAAVIDTGSIFSLSREPDTGQLIELLVSGIGGGRERGFGCIMPHPGIANAIYEPAGTVQEKSSSDRAGRIGWELWDKSGRANGPSVSQISAVIDKLIVSPKAAREYLDVQLSRHAKIWDRWKKVHKRLDSLLAADNRDETVRALKVWRDLRTGENKR